MSVSGANGLIRSLYITEKQMAVQPRHIVIVIPVHRTRLTPDETLSVSQCERILGRYDVCFACPDSVRNITGFEHIAVEHFNDEYFDGIHGYNRLMMTEIFYQRFARYTYMLIYQPDAFVFRDELLEWVERDYSYIGAPWILKAKYRTPFGRFILRFRGLGHSFRRQPFRPLLLGDKVGNGGFSLRRTADFIRVCRNEQEAIQTYHDKSTQWSEYNEDAFWATRPSFRYPTAKEALGFAFDLYPEECLRQAGHVLPFGCHGWSKTGVSDFWRPLIERQNSTRPLRVYFDYQAFNHQTFGGVSRYFTEIIARLPQYGVKPIVGVHYSDNTHLRALGIRTKPVIHRKTAKLLNRFYCRRQIGEGLFDLIHATYFDPYVLSANRHNKPLVITIHDMIDEVMGEGHHMPRRKALMAEKCTHIIAVSHHTKQDVMRILGTPEDKISVVYHGSSIVPAVPARLPVLPERYILYVGGRGRLYKNFSLFLRAMQPVVETENVKILCVGAPFTDNEQAQILSLGMKDAVLSLFAEDDHLYTIYHKALCFVYPSCYEGFGLPVLEAWAGDCPLVLSRSSCFPEIAGEAAVYFEENNAGDLTSQTLRVIRSEETRRRLIRQGRERLRQYSWDKAAEETARVYRQICSKYA